MSKRVVEASVMKSQVVTSYVGSIKVEIRKYGSYLFFSFWSVFIYDRKPVTLTGVSPREQQCMGNIDPFAKPNKCALKMVFASFPVVIVSRSPLLLSCIL